MKTNFILVFLLVISFSGFTQSEKRVKLKKGSWISHLNISESDKLPFEMSIKKQKGTYFFTAINGEEQIALNAPVSSGDSLIVRFPFFNSFLCFKVNNKKSISGYWHNLNKGANYKIPFSSYRSKRNSRFDHINKQDNTAQVDGRWAVTFEPNSDASYPAVGIFKQQKDVVTGTFLTETGDYRYLSGNTTKDSLYLSCFDGSHAFLFKAKSEKDSLKGQFFSGNHWSCDWEAKQNSNAKIEDPDKLTYLVEDKDLVINLKDIEGNDFSFPNARYKNKVTIIQIMGTWCPNCLDETHYYKELYNKYHDKGLEIISVAYETGNSFEDYASNIKTLKEKLDLDFTFVVGGAASKNLASQHFEMLNEVISFPTSIFIGRDGKVHRVHTGFNGPGTGVYYTEYIQKTNALIESLLAK